MPHGCERPGDHPRAALMRGLPKGLPRSGGRPWLKLVEDGSRLLDDRAGHIVRKYVPDYVALALGDDGADLAKHSQVLTRRGAVPADDVGEIAGRERGVAERAHDLDARRVAERIHQRAHPLLIARREHLLLGRHHGDGIDRSGNLSWHQPLLAFGWLRVAHRRPRAARPPLAQTYSLGALRKR